MMPMEEMTVRYTLTRKDLFAFNLRAVVRNRIMLIMLVVFGLWFAHMGFTTPPPEGHPPYSTGARIFATIMMCLLSIFLWCFITIGFLALSIWTGKYKNLLCEHELRLAEDGMFSRTAIAETRRKWNGLWKVRSTNNYLTLYVTETSALIVPKRSFVSHAEAQAFEQFIRERMKKE